MQSGYASWYASANFLLGMWISRPFSIVTFMLQDLVNMTELEPVVVGRKVADEEKDPEVQRYQPSWYTFPLALR